MHFRACFAALAAAISVTACNSDPAASADSRLSASNSPSDELAYTGATPLFTITAPVAAFGGNDFSYTVPGNPVAQLYFAGTTSSPLVKLKVAGGAELTLTSTAGGNTACTAAPCYWQTTTSINYGNSTVRVVGRDHGVQRSLGSIANGCSQKNDCVVANLCETWACDGDTHLCTTAPKCDPTTTCKPITCDPHVGVCEKSNAPKGTLCDDGNACTTGDACNGKGTCEPGAPVVCNDHNPCTDDSCNPATGCVYTADNNNSCSDGNACNGAEACESGVCVNTGVGACSPNAICSGNACACNPGFSGNGVTCTDINECATNNGGCGNNSICTNTPGSYSCACAPGYMGDATGHNCVDINECASNNGGCGNNSICTNTQGSFSCACAPGYMGDATGHSCVDINECLTNNGGCGSNSICTNTQGSFTCACAAGYAGDQTGHSCVDINECATNNGGCGANSTCTNTPGSYSCACQAGYAGDATGHGCVDINECTTNNGGCGSNSLCTNSPGSYSCACADGYMGDPTGHNCVDINECATNNGGCGADSICANTPGSFTCACATGYSGDSTGHNCADINECTAGTATCGANSTCTNTDGSYTCACAAGFAGDPTGRNCLDINECGNGTATCGANSICTNTPGSYTCACATGYSGDSSGRNCIANDPCLTNNGGCGQLGTCANQSGTASCICSPGAVGPTCAPCNAGYTCPSATGNTMQVICPAGSQCPTGSATPAACLAGSWSAAGAAVCTPCSIDTYSSSSGATSCTACGLGTTAAAGATSCSACPPGSTDPLCTDTTVARYVRLQNRRYARLGIAEVEVFSGGIDVALNKTATMSSVGQCGVYDCPNPDPSYAVNGALPKDVYGYTGNYGAVTDFEAQAWWQVDLGAPVAIDEISLIALAFTEEYATDFDVEVSSDGSTWSKVHYEPGSMNDEVDIYPKPSCTDATCSADACGSGACMQGTCTEDPATPILYADFFDYDTAQAGDGWNVNGYAYNDSPGFWVDGDGPGQPSWISTVDGMDPTGTTLTWSAAQIADNATGFSVGWLNGQGATPGSGVELSITFANDQISFDAYSSINHSHNYFTEPLALTYYNNYESGYEGTVRLYVDSYRWSVDSGAFHQSGAWVQGFSLNDVVNASGGQMTPFGAANSYNYLLFESMSVRGSFCNDNNNCTGDSCDPAAGCTHAPTLDQQTCPVDTCTQGTVCDPATFVCTRQPQPNGVPCDDGNPCTQTDSCQAGVCTGLTKTCAAIDSCHTAGICDPGSGNCSTPNRPDGVTCDDGNACTHGDICQNGACTGQTFTPCYALDQCHQVGICDPGTGVCSNPKLADGTQCDDGVNCTSNDICTNGFCAGTAIVCAAIDGCHTAGQCDEASGLCSEPVDQDGTICATANGTAACVQGSCNATSCNSGYQLDSNGINCVDIDECTAGTYICDANKDCYNIPGSYQCVCKPGATGTAAGSITIHGGLPQPDDGMLSSGQIQFSDGANRAINLSSAAVIARLANGDVTLQANGSISVLDLCEGGLGASGNHALTLQTANGDITATDFISAGNLNLTAGGTGNINVSTLSAQQGLSVTAGASVSINGVSTANNININAGTALNVNASLTAPGGINLTSSGTIAGAGSITTTGNANLNATYNIGASNARVQTSATTLSSSSAAGSIYLQQAGAVTLNNLNANGAGQTIDVIASGALSFNQASASAGTVNLSGASIYMINYTPLTALMASLSATGDIGSINTRINLQVNSIGASSSAGNVYLSQYVQPLTVALGYAGGTFDVSTDYSMTVGTITGATVNLGTSTAAGTTLSQSPGGLITSSGTLNISSQGDMGTSGAPLNTQVAALKAFSGNGNIVVRQGGPLNLVAAETSGSGKMVNIATASGGISCGGGGGGFIGGSGTSTVTITIAAGGAGSSITGCYFSSSTVTATAGGDLGSAASPVSTSGQALNLTAGGNIYMTTGGAAPTYTVNANGSVVSLNDQSQGMYINSISAPNALVTLNSASAFVNMATGGSSIASSSLNIIAGQIGTSALPIATKVASLAFSGQTPNVYVAEADDILLDQIAYPLGSVNISAGGNITIGAMSGTRSGLSLHAGGAIFAAPGGGIEGIAGQGGLISSNLTATSIGTPGSRLTTEGTIYAEATSGSIYMGGDSNGLAIYSLRTDASGETIDVSGPILQIQNGQSGISAPGGIINLEATGAAGSISGTGNLGADTLNLTSTGSISVRTTANVLNLASTGVCNVTNNGSATLGTVAVGSGQLLMSNGDATIGNLNSTGTTSLFGNNLIASSTSMISGNTWSLNSNYNFGSAGVPIPTTASTVLASASAANMWISPAGPVQLSAQVLSNGGVLNITGSGDLTINQAATSTIGGVNNLSTTGALILGSPGTFTAQSATLSAGNNIGSASGRFPATNKGSFAATSTNGSVYLTAGGQGTLTQVTAAQAVDISATSNNLNIGNLSGGGSVTIADPGTVSLNQVTGLGISAPVVSIAANEQMGSSGAPILIAAGQLSATSSQGQLFLSLSGDTQLNNLSGSPSLTVASNGNLVVQGNVTGNYSSGTTTLGTSGANTSITQGTAGLVTGHVVSLSAIANVGSVATPLQVHAGSITGGNGGVRSIHNN